MAYVIKNNIFASDMSVIKEHISIISYNFRKLRHTHNQSIDFISEKTGIDMQVLARLENEKNCGLSTAIGIAIHFKVTLNDLIKERDYNKNEITILKKRESTHRSLIPHELHFDLFNYLAAEQEYINRMSLLNFVEFLEYRAQKARVINKNSHSARKNKKNTIFLKINKLAVSESVVYDKNDHLLIFKYIFKHSFNHLTLRRERDTYICTRIL